METRRAVLSKQERTARGALDKMETAIASRRVLRDAYERVFMEPNEQGNDSEELDLVTVFESAGSSSEMEALQVQALLESNGIKAVLIGDAVLPNIPEEVRVAREDLARAQQLIADALAAGPAAALEAETAGETTT